MSYCKISIYLAYLASVYILASIFYLILSPFLGTPFKNAIKTKYPELEIIKKDSAKKRGTVFVVGIVLSILFLLVLKPFHKC